MKHSIICMLLVLVGSAFYACSPADDDDQSVGEESPTPGPGPVDADGDGFNSHEDCDDTNAAISPDATEVCDDLDNDCDDRVDEDIVFLNYYEDADGDGYGNDRGYVQACKRPDGFVTNATDCDDSDPDVHPNATEVCNGVDDDCDNDVDEGLLRTYYIDVDGDGFALNTATPIEACDAEEGATEFKGDCNDGDPAVHPILVNPVSGSSAGDGTVDAPIDTIQGALSAIGTCRLIVLDDGTYEAGVTLTGVTDLTLESVHGPEVTRIETTSKVRALQIQSCTDITVRGLALEAGEPVTGSGAALLVFGSTSILLQDLIVENSQVSGDMLGGGGIGIVSSEEVTVADSVIRRNQAYQGAGIVVDAASATITNSIIENNQATVNGGGVAVVNTMGKNYIASVRIEGSSVNKNKADEKGGGVYVEFGHDGQFVDSSFDGNELKVASQGGAIFNPREVYRCEFFENDADMGGAVAIRAWSTVKNSLFWENTAFDAGGAIYINDSSDVVGRVEIINNTMVNNVASLLLGASLHFFDVDDLLVRNNIMADFVTNAANVHSMESNQDVSHFDHNDIFSSNGTPFGGVLFQSDAIIGSDGNIDVNPRFVNYVENSYTDGDLQLAIDSPCRDTGNPDVGNDSDGSPPDMGAYGGPDPLQ